MNIINFFTRKFRKGTGSSAIIFVPRHTYNNVQKLYINLIDIIGNKSLDFRQIIARLISMKGTRSEFQKLNFGSENDAYQIQTYMESSLNLLVMQIENAIQSEFRCRETIMELDDLYEDLTNLTLTADQKATLLEFEKIYTQKYLGKATTNHKEDIMEGNSATKEILESEHEILLVKLQKEKDDLVMTEHKTKNFKPIAQNQQKDYFKRKANEYPSLTKVYMTKLQEGLDSTKNIQNGAGTFSFMESNETASSDNNNNDESPKK